MSAAGFEDRSINLVLRGPSYAPGKSLKLDMPLPLTYKQLNLMKGHS